MKTLCRSLMVLALVAFVAPAVRAADEEAPNINKRGDNEKAFVEKLATSIVKAARTATKTATLDTFEKKMPKEGRLEYHIKATWKGAVLGKNQTSEIIVHVDTSTKDRWEVTRIEYNDDSKSLAKYNRKNVDAMVDKLNGK